KAPTAIHHRSLWTFIAEEYPRAISKPMATYGAMPETAPPEPSHPDRKAAASAIVLTARRRAATAGRRTRQQLTPRVTADESPSENFTSRKKPTSRPASA